MKSDEILNKTDFHSANLDDEYDNCTFHGCNFSEIDLTGISFLECEFYECNFTLASLKQSAFKDVIFEKCKMLGLKFNELNPFLLQMHFKECHLQETSFYQLNLKSSTFKSCKLQGADFTESNLEGSLLQDCDLSDCNFERTVLKYANLIGSYNFNIDPENNQIRGARFSSDALPGLLLKYQIYIDA